MALNKERKILCGLLGSAGLILVVDQVLLGPPQGAQAGISANAQAPAPPATTEPASKPAMPKSTSTGSGLVHSEQVQSWNDRLGKATTDIASPQGMNDPFSALEKREPEAPGVMSPSDFEREHKLTALLTGGDIGVAMINGTSVRVGQEVSGYRLIRVDTRSAEFLAGEVTVRLMLPKQGAGGS